MVQNEHTLLVVDDEEQVRELTCRALERKNYMCETAADGDAALQKLSEKRYDLVITDLRMPVVNGYSLAAEVLSWPQPPQVMVVTGIADGRLVKDLLSRGVVDILHKPIPYDILATKVQAIFERENWRQEKIAENRIPRLREIEAALLRNGAEFTEKLDVALANIANAIAPPPAISGFIQRLHEVDATPVAQPTSEILIQRAERFHCSTLVTMVPVNQRFEPIGEARKLHMWDISASGMRLIHSSASSSEFVALQWNATQLTRQRLRIFGRVARCEPILRFYELGLQFVQTG